MAAISISLTSRPAIVIRQMSVTQVSAYHRPFIFAYKQGYPFSFLAGRVPYGAATYVYAVDDAGNLTLKSTYDGSFYSFADVGNGTLLGAPENFHHLR